LPIAWLTVPTPNERNEKCTGIDTTGQLGEAFQIRATISYSVAGSSDSDETTAPLFISTMSGLSQVTARPCCMRKYCE
jgi:hypothetical protein